MCIILKTTNTCGSIVIATHRDTRHAVYRAIKFILPTRQDKRKEYVNIWLTKRSGLFDLHRRSVYVCLDLKFTVFMNS